MILALKVLGVIILGLIGIALGLFGLWAMIVNKEEKNLKKDGFYD